MKLVRLMIMFSLCIFLAGCFEVNQEFVLRRDGSGTMGMEMVLSPEFADLLAGAGETPPQTAGLPFSSSLAAVPASEAEIRKLATEGLSLEEANISTNPDGSQRIRFKFGFENISTFAGSATTEKFPFVLEPAGKGQVVFRVSNFLMSKEFQMASNGKENLKKGAALFKLLFRGLKFRLTAVLPNEIVSSNAGEVKGNKAVWNMDLDKMKTSELIDESGRPRAPEAVFSAEGIKFALPIRSVAKAEEPGVVPQKKPVSAGAPAGAVPEDRCTVKPVTLFIQRTMSFSDGVPGDPRRSFDLHLNLVCPEKVPYDPTDFALIIDKAMTDTGENLSPERSPEGKFSGGGAYNGMREFFMPLALKAPLQGGTTLRFSGKVLIGGASESRKARVGNAGTWIGRRIDTPELSTKEIRMLALSDSEAQLRFPENAYRLLKEVIFLGKDGKPLQGERSMTMTGMGPEGTTDVYYRLSGMPETMEFLFYDEIKKYELPFSFEALPLP